MKRRSILESWKCEDDEWDYNWREAFGYAGGPNADSNSAGSIPEAAPLGANVSIAPFGLDDVAEVFAASDGENDERDWVCYGRLIDGRYFSLAAWCDYTGWDCRAGGAAQVANTREEIERFGMTNEMRERLGVVLK